MRFNTKQMRAMKDKARAAGLDSGNRRRRLVAVACFLLGIAVTSVYHYNRPADIPRWGDWLYARYVGEARQ